MRIRRLIEILFTSSLLAALLVASLTATSSDLRLVEAAKKRETQVVSVLLNQDLDVNMTQPDGATALHWAAHWDHIEIAELLIQAGARVNAANDHGVTPLWLACLNGSAPMVEKLLKADANPNATLPTGETVLMRAARTGKAEIVRALLADGADVNAKEASGQTALMWAAVEGHVEVARVLIEGGADIRGRSTGGFTPLLFAAWAGSLDVTRLLVTSGVDVNQAAPFVSLVDSTEKIDAATTPLLMAISRGHIPVAEFLLGEGADPNADSAGFTVLHWVAGTWETTARYRNNNASHEWRALMGLQKGPEKLQLIRMLLAHGANPNARTKKTPPRLAWGVGPSNNPELIELIGATPFLLAAMAGDVAVMRLLVDAGADPLLATTDNKTPLMQAAGVARMPGESLVTEQSALEAVNLAWELGGDVNAIDSLGESAVHGAASEGFDSVLQFLVQKGADVNAKNGDGDTPLSIASGTAARRGGRIIAHENTATLLRKLGAKENSVAGYTKQADAGRRAPGARNTRPARTLQDDQQALPAGDQRHEQPEKNSDPTSNTSVSPKIGTSTSRFKQLDSTRAPLAPLSSTLPLHTQSPNTLPLSTMAQRALLNKYCVSCHNQKTKTAGLMLDMANVENVGADALLWEKVVHKLRSRAMPPPGMPRPDKADYDGLIGGLVAALDRQAETTPNPGRPAIHRLNRAEYTNAIRDLLSLEIDGRLLLPADDSSYGFDNIADVLSVSQGLLERYVSAARKISQLAIGADSARPASETYRISPLMLQDDRMGEDLPFGSRGGMAIRHNFPADGEYLLTVVLQEVGIGFGIRGGQDAHQMDVRVDGVRVALITRGDPKNRAKLEDRYVKLRLPVKAGSRLIQVAFVRNKSSAHEGLGPAHYPLTSSSFAHGGFAQKNHLMVVGRLDIDGPYAAIRAADTPARRQIFVCRPTLAVEEESCAKTILSRVARRAYRRPVTQEDLKPLLDFYRTGRSEGDFETGIQRALERILVSMEFLFRAERDRTNSAPGAPFGLTGFELASRLSFFLWSSIPDDELFDLADRGRLTNPTVLEGQTKRMLGDGRAKALADNFFGQWLSLRSLQGIVPDASEFPDFDDDLRNAFEQETGLVVQSHLREDRSVSDLLTADFTYVNERLARHYGMPNVYGSHFRRVKYPEQTRVGLLGHGSILTLTSYPTRTSPVKRGKWVLDNLLGTPPPSPPPNVEGLPERGDDGKPLPVRARMEKHRKNPVCASCHAQMDPIGFALENYDGIGRWRTTDQDNEPINSSGSINSTEFRGPDGLRQFLLDRREEFVGTVTEKLLTYALGRGLEYYDMPAVRKIVREAAGKNYRWSAIITGIVKSTPFRMRRAES